MPVLSDYARKRKIEFFLKPIPKDARVLEIGCGAGWVGDYLRDNGRCHFVGMDLVPPADVVGSITDWRQLGLEPESFDVIVAFEVVEHVDCFAECYDLLKPGGRLLLTTPLPHMDWIEKILERIGLSQRRTSPHDHLVYLRDVACFEDKRIRTFGFLDQWGILEKTGPERGSRR